MKKDLKIAVIQAKVPRVKEEGEAQILRLVNEAIKESVDIVGLPEDCVASRQEIINGYDAFRFLSSVAKKFNICLFGATAIKRDDALYDVGFLFDRDGRLIASHDKVVLTPIEEAAGLKSGQSLDVFDTEFGKMTILVCKDAFHRYAAWFFDKLRKAGVDVVLVPSYSFNVSERSIQLWTESLKILSVWFDVYIVASGTIGSNISEFPSFGHAMIVSPKTVVIAQGSQDKEEILRATLDVKSLEDVRQTVGSKWQPKSEPQIKIIEL